MTNLFVVTNMVLLCGAWMGFGAGSILEYLHIQQITLRSKPFVKPSDVLANG